jgi:hypothetical protein
VARRNFVLLFSPILLVLAIPAAGFAKPNFTGTWKINIDKSDFGQIPAPEKMERTISHEDPSLKFKTVQSGPQGEVTTEMAYTTDGKPSTNKTPRGEVTGTARWEGDTLAIDTQREFQGMEIKLAERWNLSEDGKVLTIHNKVTTSQGEFEIKVVLDKQ